MPKIDTTQRGIAAARTVLQERPELFSALGIGIAAFVLYAITLAPGITWSNLGADGGDLLTAAFTWGIPHPSGYPTYLLGLRGFAFVFPFGDEAFQANLFSALLAAVAASFVFLSSVRLIEIVPSLEKLNRWTLLTSAGLSALAVGVSRELWSQATITEVYALNAFFVSLLMYGVLTLYRRHSRGEDEGRLRIILALVLGVGLGNHLTLAMIAIPFIAWSYLWGGSRETTIQRIRDWRVPAAFITGIAVYLYAPLASSGDPLLNWGHPENGDGFWWMLSGSIYQDYQFGVEAADIGDRLLDLGDLILSQYAFVGLVLSIAGLTFVWESHKGFAISGVVGILLVTSYAIGYDTIDSFLYVIPVFMLMGIWMSVGIAMILQASSELPRLVSRARWPRFWQLASVVILLGAIPGFSAFSNFDTMNLSDDRAAIQYAETSINAAEPGSVMIVGGTAELFSLWYQSYVAQPEADVLVVSIAHLQFDWYWDDIRDQAPDLIPMERPEGFAERAQAVVDFNLGLAPVYLAGDVSFYERDYTLVQQETIYRVTP